MKSANDLYTVRVDSLAPGEEVLLEILAVNADPPLVTTVRSDDAVGKQVQLNLQRVFPGWVNTLLISTFLLGAASAVYLLISLLQLLVRL